MAGAELAGTEAYSQGKPCPKCGYVRTAADTNPAWQCPKCQIAYLKYRPAPARLHERVAAHGRALAGVAASDRSTWSLVAANLLAIAIARLFGMTLRDLMLVFWLQSVIIGLSYFVRMLCLKDFSTDGFTTSGGEVPETTGGKVFTAMFFAFHYGFFHAVYLVFLLGGMPQFGRAPAPPPLGGLVLCGLVFAVHQVFSTAKKIVLERAGRPNLGKLMFTPYVRIFPMHLTIIFGAMLGPGLGSWLLFVGLKTAADVAMHVKEQHMTEESLPEILPEAPPPASSP